MKLRNRAKVTTPVEPTPEVAPIITQRRTPTALERHLTRAPGTVGYATGPDGGVTGPPQPDAPTIEAPDDPQEYIEVDSAAWFGTSEARLCAEGWRPPRPDLHANILKREAIRQAARLVRERRKQDISLVGDAINEADPAKIVEAMIPNGLDLFAAQQSSPQSAWNGWSYQLEVEWRALMYQHQRSILQSLIGRDSPAANRLRQTVESYEQMPGMPVPPSTPAMNAYLIYL